MVLLGTFGQSACGNSSVKERSLTPWERQYKIKPNEKNRLTPADVLGPDGIVYPNWTKCGVQGGIPKIKAVTSIEDFGAKANDDADDSEALAKACEAAGKMGGGAVLLGEGTYYLDRPVTVRHDDVVIRGKGPRKDPFDIPIFDSRERRCFLQSACWQPGGQKHTTRNAL